MLVLCNQIYPVHIFCYSRDNHQRSKTHVYLYSSGRWALVPVQHLTVLFLPSFPSGRRGRSLWTRLVFGQVNYPLLSKNRFLCLVDNLMRGFIFIFLFSIGTVICEKYSAVRIYSYVYIYLLLIIALLIMVYFLYVMRQYVKGAAHIPYTYA